MTKSRTIYTLINTTFGILSRIIILILSFVLRTVFIKYMGIQYMGVSSLFADVLTVLSFAELGIGGAITYALYKPIHENDKILICKLMNFYRKAYTLVAIFILFAGLLLTPFIGFLVNDVPDINESIAIIFLLYVVNTFFSYIFIYKSSLITASQKQYVVSRIQIFASIVKTVGECVIIIITKNFIFFLLFGIIITIIQNLIISIVASKMFPFIKDIKHKKISKEDQKKLLKDIKALSMYKVSHVVLKSSDSMVVSGFLGTSTVGYLSNYKLIINNINSFVNQFYNSLTSSVGNLSVEGDGEKQYNIFKILLFITFIITCISSSLFLNLINPFIKIWLGSDFLLSFYLVIVITFEFYLTSMMQPISSFRIGNGLFVHGQYRPVIMTILNIVISIILVQLIGLTGVLLGTIISKVLTQIWYDPLLLYRRVFGKDFRNFIFIFVKYMIVSLIITVVSYSVINIIKINNSLISLLLSGIICLFISIIFIIVIFRNSNEYKVTKNIGFNIVRKIFKKKLVND